MAVVVGPLHSSEARGQVGGKTGLVYNSHHGRAYVKANAVPTLEYTDPQRNTRAIMVPIIAAWQALSEETRAAWAGFADENHLCDWTGQLKRLSAWNWFVKINFRNYMTHLQIRLEPPDRITAYRLPKPTLIIIPGLVEMEWTVADPPPDPAWSIMFWLSEPHSITSHPSFKMAKYNTYANEQDGAQVIEIAVAGWYSLWWLLVSAQGITMPPEGMRLEVT
jgi:hypothetical protein